MTMAWIRIERLLYPNWVLSFGESLGSWSAHMRFHGAWRWRCSDRKWCIWSIYAGKQFGSERVNSVFSYLFRIELDDGLLPFYSTWAGGFLPLDIGAENKDFDNEGVNHLMEYASGGDPLRPLGGGPRVILKAVLRFSHLYYTSHVIGFWAICREKGVDWERRNDANRFLICEYTGLVSGSSVLGSKFLRPSWC